MIAPGLLALALALAPAPAPGDAGAPAAPAARPEIFLSHHPVEKRSPRPWAGGAGFRVVLERDRPPRARDELARRQGGRLVAGGHLALDVAGYPASKDRPAAAHRRASFVIDFDDPPVRAFREELARALGPTPTVAQLTAFVHQRLRQTMARGFDVASTVAQRREGDCSEHAVLLAALLRASGRPARVVFGLAILPAGGGVMAEGHAWVEHFERGRWQPADAALVGVGVPVLYLPLDLMTDEGPGFALASTTMSLPFVRKVIIEER